MQADKTFENENMNDEIDAKWLVGILNKKTSEKITRGGSGSGNFGHKGRPGEIGGSGGGETEIKTLSTYQAIIQNQFAAKGDSISLERANEVLQSLNSFKGNATPIRMLQTGQEVDPRLLKIMKVSKESMIKDGENIEEWIKTAPNYEGPLYRGVTLTQEDFDALKVNTPTNQLGISSWTGNETFARGYSTRYEGVPVIFKMSNSLQTAAYSSLGFKGIDDEILMSKDAQQVVTNIQQTDNLWEVTLSDASP